MDSDESTDPAARRPARTRMPGAGRRRNPAIDERLRQAARVLYAREGWAGFHFDGVAKAAQVSKDAVYRRYRDAQALLVDAVSNQVFPTIIVNGPIEEALVTFACDLYIYFAGGDGNANLRIHADGVKYPEVLQQYRIHVVQPQIEKCVRVLEQTRTDGELHPDTSPTAVVEALAGAVMFYALSSTSSLDRSAEDVPIIDAAAQRQLTDFVQQILHGRLITHSD